MKITDSNSNPDDDIMKENPNYVRKRKPINFTMEDLEADQIEDEAFQINIEPGDGSITRNLPSRNCKPKYLSSTSNLSKYSRGV